MLLTMRCMVKKGVVDNIELASDEELANFYAQKRKN